MITYEDIYEAARKERYSEQLQPIIPDFAGEVSVYLNEKKNILSQDENVFSGVSIKTKKQLENAITLFRELMLRRRKKILSLVLIAAETGISKKDFENMLDFEKVLFDDLTKCLDVSDKTLNEILEVKKVENSRCKVLFIKDVGEFVGLGGEKMGPYKQGEISDIPRQIMDVLIEDESVEFVEG